MITHLELEAQRRGEEARERAARCGAPYADRQAAYAAAVKRYLTGTPQGAAPDDGSAPWSADDTAELRRLAGVCGWIDGPTPEDGAIATRAAWDRGPSFHMVYAAPGGPMCGLYMATPIADGRVSNRDDGLAVFERRRERALAAIDLHRSLLEQLDKAVRHHIGRLAADDRHHDLHGSWVALERLGPLEHVLERRVQAAILGGPRRGPP